MEWLSDARSRAARWRSDTVKPTINEVEHGTAFTPVDLIVVDNIVPIIDPVTGELRGATGGR